MTGALPPPRYVLGVDQSTKASGWALRETGMGPREILRHGLARDYRDRVDVLALALMLAGGDPRELFVQFEDHGTIPLDYGTRKQKRRARKTTGALFDAGPTPTRKGPTRGTRQILGLGAALGRWEEDLDRMGHPEALRGYAEPRVWRRRVLGNQWATKDEAQTYARPRLGLPPDARLNHNVAEGLALADFGAFDGVQGLLARRAVGRAADRDRRALARQESFDDDEDGL